LSSFVLGKEDTLSKETLPPKETPPLTQEARSTKAVKKAVIDVFKEDYLIRAGKNK
jgi:hypothetical protein